MSDHGWRETYSPAEEILDGVSGARSVNTFSYLVYLCRMLIYSLEVLQISGPCHIFKRSKMITFFN